MGTPRTRHNAASTHLDGKDDQQEARERQKARQLHFMDATIGSSPRRPPFGPAMHGQPYTSPGRVSGLDATLDGVWLVDAIERFSKRPAKPGQGADWTRWRRPASAARPSWTTTGQRLRPTGWTHHGSSFVVRPGKLRCYGGYSAGSRARGSTMMKRQDARRWCCVDCGVVSEWFMTPIEVATTFISGFRLNDRRWCGVA